MQLFCLKSFTSLVSSKDMALTLKKPKAVKCYVKLTKFVFKIPLSTNLKAA